MDTNRSLNEIVRDKTSEIREIKLRIQSIIKEVRGSINVGNKIIRESQLNEIEHLLNLI